MSSSSVLTIFGLNKTQRSMRKMHQTLVHYHLLPGPGPLDRATLWSALLVLVQTLDEDEGENLRSWTTAAIFPQQDILCRLLPTLP
jgi:hypothetical protein